MSRPKGTKNKPKESNERPESPIYASVRVLGKTYTAEGETVHDAIQNLKVGIPRGISILTVEKGDIKKEKILSIFQTQRLFGPGSAMTKEIILKQVAMLFEGVF